jgi:hypothetical protein
VRQLQNSINDVRVATPCSAEWDKMLGDERIRHCTLCSLNVYNLSEMSGDEIHALLVSTEGRVCGKLYRRADGTMLTRDCPSAIRAMGQQISRLSTLAIATLFSFSAFAWGGSTCAKPRVKKDGSKVTLEIDRSIAQERAMFTGVVRDEAGDPLPGASIELLEEAVQRKLATVTDANGAFTIGAADDGLYQATVRFDGFKSAVIEHLALKRHEATRAQVTMRLDSITVMMGALAVDPLITNQPLSTTFSQELVNKLPISPP